MKNLSVKVSNDMYQEIKSYADSNSMSLSEFIRNSVTQSLHQGDKEVIPAYDLLREQLNEANEARQRADTIIMQLTKQVEQQALALEDKTNQLDEKQEIIEDIQNLTFWKRIKLALGFTPERV